MSRVNPILLAAFSLFAILSIERPAAAEDKEPKTPVQGSSGLWIGIAIKYVDDADRPTGSEARLMVESVYANAPAAKGKLESGDLILAVNDKPIQEYADLLRAVDESGGKTLKFKIAREGKPSIIEIKPEKRPASQPEIVEGRRQGADEARRQQERAEEELREAHRHLDELIQRKRIEKQIEPRKEAPKPVHPPGPDEARRQQQQAEAKLREAREQLDKLIHQKWKEAAEHKEASQPGVRAQAPDGGLVLITPPTAAGGIKIIAGSLPEDMEVTIQRRGNTPAKIIVKQGHREWRTIETDLEMLPPEAKTYILKSLEKRPLLPAELPLKLRVQMTPGMAAEKDAEKASQAEMLRLQEEILMLHRELQESRKAWDEKIKELSPRK